MFILYMYIHVYIYIQKESKWVSVYIFFWDPNMFNWGSGDTPTTSTSTQVIEVVTDSMMPAAGDCDGTLLPYSPSQTMNTSAAIETLKDVDSTDQARESEVPIQSNTC